MVHKPVENLDTTQPYKYVVLGDGAKKSDCWKSYQNLIFKTDN